MPYCEPAAVMPLPPLEHSVTVTLADGREFSAMRVIVVDGSSNDCWAWSTSDEWEPLCPPCWTDGTCWASNGDETPSMPVVAWRETPK